MTGFVNSLKYIAAVLLTSLVFWLLRFLVGSPAFTISDWAALYGDGGIVPTNELLFVVVSVAVIVSSFELFGALFGDKAISFAFFGLRPYVTDYTGKFWHAATLLCVEVALTLVWETVAFTLTIFAADDFVNGNYVGALLLAILVLCYWVVTVASFRCLTEALFVAISGGNWKERLLFRTAFSAFLNEKR